MRALAVAALATSVLASGCAVASWAYVAAPAVAIPIAIRTPEGGLDGLPVVPSAEARVVGDIRGVQLSPESGGERIEFSDVTEVRWGSTELVITGTVDTSGSLERRLSPTTSVPLEDVDYVIVRDYDPGGSYLSSFLGAAAGTAAGMFLVTLTLTLLAFSN